MIAENQRLIRVRDSDDEMTCIVCPIGCRLTVHRREDGSLDVTGNRCKRGVAYAEEEFSDPRRMVTGTVAVESGRVARLPVKSSESVPVDLIPKFLNAMYELRVRAPVTRGECLAENLAGTERDLIATMKVEKEA